LLVRTTKISAVNKKEESQLTRSKKSDCSIISLRYRLTILKSKSQDNRKYGSIETMVRNACLNIICSRQWTSSLRTTLTNNDRSRILSIAMTHSNITSSINTRRYLSTSSTEDDFEEEENTDTMSRDNITATAAVTNVDKEMKHQRIWRPEKNSTTDTLYWRENVLENAHSDPHNLVSLLDRIEKQELDGGRMRDRQNGVLHEDPAVDMRLLIEQYTVNSLASALRDREEMLQMASKMAAENKFETLKEFLHDCHPDVVLRRRQRLRQLCLNTPFNFARLETIRKALMRMPRQVTMGHSRRAGVVIALVHVDGVPSLLLEKRSASLRAHPDEVCLPGGMYCKEGDRTIVETCLREMKEEIGGFDFDYHRETGVTNGISVLGTLRCNWGEGKSVFID
jgi:hypothetical protein